MASTSGSSGAPDVRPNVDALHETIQQQIVATNYQSKWLMRLTWAAVFLGVVQAIGTVIQVWISFKPASSL